MGWAITTDPCVRCGGQVKTHKQKFGWMCGPCVTLSTQEARSHYGNYGFNRDYRHGGEPGTFPFEGGYVIWNSATPEQIDAYLIEVFEARRRERFRARTEELAQSYARSAEEQERPSRGRWHAERLAAREAVPARPDVSTPAATPSTADNADFSWLGEK